MLGVTLLEFFEISSALINRALLFDGPYIPVSRLYLDAPQVGALA